MAIPEQYVKSGKIIREVREWIKGNIRVGTRILDIAVKVEEEIIRRGGQPAFPTGIGVNDVTAHYAPQEDESGKIEADDIVKIDYGVHFEGYLADTSITITDNPHHQPLLDATEKALRMAVEAAKRDRRIGEISRAIEATATAEGFKPISNLSGHTVQQYIVHSGKSIPNLYTPGLPMLKKGDVFAIEPFLTYPDAAGYVVNQAGNEATIFSLIIRKKTGDRELDDLLERIWGIRKTLPFTPRWFNRDYKEGRLLKLLQELERRRLVRSYPTLVEASGKPVAQFEHTLTIGDTGVTILT